MSEGKSAARDIMAAGGAEMDGDGDDGLELAMQQLGQALAKKDWKSAAKLFQSAASMCGSYEPE